MPLFGFSSYLSGHDEGIAANPRSTYDTHAPTNYHGYESKEDILENILSSSASNDTDISKQSSSNSVGIAPNNNYVYETKQDDISNFQATQSYNGSYDGGVIIMLIGISFFLAAITGLYFILTRRSKFYQNEAYLFVAKGGTMKVSLKSYHKTNNCAFLNELIVDSFDDIHKFYTNIKEISEKEFADMWKTCSIGQ